MTEQSQVKKTMQVERTLQLSPEQVAVIVTEWASKSVPGFEDDGHVWTNAASLFDSRYFVVSSRKEEELR